MHLQSKKTQENTQRKGYWMPLRENLDLKNGTCTNIIFKTFFVIKRKIFLKKKKKVLGETKDVITAEFRGKHGKIASHFLRLGVPQQINKIKQ